MRLLVAEDERDLAQTLRRALEEEAFAVDLAEDGEDALFKIREMPYDAVILDLMLPQLDGWTVLQTARADGIRTPMLVLTARDTIEDRVRGLNLGADDYLTKPFALAELIARVHAMIRRAYGNPVSTLQLGELTIDTAARQVSRAGVRLRGWGSGRRPSSGSPGETGGSRPGPTRSRMWTSPWGVHHRTTPARSRDRPRRTRSSGGMGSVS